MAEVLALERMLGLVVVGAESVAVGLRGNSVVWLWFFVFVVSCSRLAASWAELSELTGPGSLVGPGNY